MASKVCVSISYVVVSNTINLNEIGNGGKNVIAVEHVVCPGGKAACCNRVCKVACALTVINCSLEVIYKESLTLNERSVRI